MSNQEQESSDVTTVSENAEIKTTDENQLSNNNENENSSISSENKTSNNSTISNEQETTRRITMPQDIRYSTEQGDREKLVEKYNNYQVSDTNSCNIRFLTDYRQKKNLLGRNEGRNFK